jgi:hypothetical protein
MPTKKAVKKAASRTKKKEVKKRTRPAPKVEEVEEQPAALPQVVSVAPVSELFDTSPAPAQQVEVEPNSALLFVNGSSRGHVETSGMTLGEFAINHANRQGIRSFSLYANGQKVDTSQSNIPMTGIHKVEIVAKDSRG